MKSEEVDELAIMAHGGGPGQYYSNDVRSRAVQKLATALKSALADSERIDWLEGVADYVDVIVDGDHASLYQYYNPEKTLREAIDERRKA